MVSWQETLETCASVTARPLQILLFSPLLLYLGTLTVLLFRPPDLDLYCLDRIAFATLVIVVGLRALLLREYWRPPRQIVWPMAALLILVLTDLLSRPFEIQVWSVAAAKYFVPYTLFYLGGVVFQTSAARRQLEIFLLVVLAYLVYLALASLAHLDFLVFPKFILDTGIGLNAMRARGPFLQPVANGAALNALGLIALDAYGRSRLRGGAALILIVGLPFAILATLTRSVWLGFGVSTFLLLRWTLARRVRRVCWAYIVAGVLCTVFLAAGEAFDAAGERATDAETVNFRMAAYQAGWTMFQEHPLTGWGASLVQTELADRIEGFHGEVFVIHNTYFEILLEHGVLGCTMFVWLVAGLIGIGRTSAATRNSPQGFLDGPGGRHLWLLLLSVYLINAIFVVMNYQFVNGLLFTVAGILAYKDQASTRADLCACPHDQNEAMK